MAKRVDLLKAKQKKQKIVLAVLGVVFVGLLAFEGPKTWKKLHPPATPVASARSTPTGTPPAGTPTLAAPTLQGAAPAPAGAAATSTDSLAASGTAALQEGQLANFSRFASKDPFAQQLGGDKQGASSSSSKGGSSGSGSASSAPTTPPSSGKAPTPGTAVISVNGSLYTVSVGTDFPQASSTDPSLAPFFHLVSVTAHTAKIAIVGGSYASGAASVTLKENKPVTLMNTADGTRYKLILKPAGTGVPTAPTTTTTPTSTTVALPPATP